MRVKINWNQHFKTWKESGLSKSEYCRQNHLNKSSFYGASRKGSGSPARLIELPFSFSPTQEEKESLFEFHFSIPFSFRLRVNFSCGKSIMIPSPSKELIIFLRPGSTDMRKATNGLSGMIQNELGQNPYEESLFVFGNRRKDLINILYWDRNGFCLCQKRLERDRLPWPEDEREIIEITPEQLNWLLNGIDFRRAHRTLHYTKTG